MIVDSYRRWKSKATQKTVTVVNRANDQHNNLRFRAGIDAIYAQHLKAKLTPAVFRATTMPLQVLRSDGSSDRRWQVDLQGRSTLMSERKAPVARYDIALLAHNYDIRISAASEQAETLSSTEPAPSDNSWTMERRKKRVTYKALAKEFSLWQIDFTEVNVLQRSLSGVLGAGGAAAGAASSSKEVEVEFELDHETARNWLKETNEQKVIELTRMIAQQLVCLLDYCIPSESATEGECSLAALPRDCDVEEEIKKLNSVLQGVYDQRARPGRFDFLGSMPVNLTRRNLLEVQSKEYFLAEKSDGLRYLLYVVPDHSRARTGAAAAGISSSGGGMPLMAVLVNRSRVVYTFRGYAELGEALGAGTVLDGELVYNRSFKENVFLVFDALMWKGQSCLRKTFAERSQLIREEVMPQYTQQISRLAPADPSKPVTQRPLGLVRKVFVPRKDLRAGLLDKLRMEDGDRIFFDTPKRHHKSDGIILQPNTPYTFSKNYDLMKWKWAELRSVDLQIVRSTSETDINGAPVLYLKCGGPEGNLIDCSKRGDTNVGLGEFDTYRLLADIEDPELGAKTAGVFIAEVAYDPQVGLWSYCLLRKDKDQPNFIDSVLGVFTEQAEAISVEELEYRLNAAAHGLDDDYEAQLQKMKTKLLHWQRTERLPRK